MPRFEVFWDCWGVVRCSRAGLVGAGVGKGEFAPPRTAFQDRLTAQQSKSFSGMHTLWADHFASPRGSSEEPGGHEVRGQEGAEESAKRVNRMRAISMEHIRGGAPPTPTSVGFWRGSVEASVLKRLGQSGR